MRRPGPGPSGGVAAMLFGALLLSGAVDATHLGKRDTIHRINKVFVEVQHLKRGNPTCPADYSMCPESLSGGCCPGGYACATDSCYATTAGTGTACGRRGYFACGIAAGLGCCPEGYICQPNECVAPAGVSYSFSCPANYYMCPSSVGNGCCQNGLGCARHACYATTPITGVFTQTFATAIGSSTVTTTSTVTTVSTPTAPANLPADTAVGFPKLIMMTQAKVAATSAPDTGSGGLTTAQIGGIVGGIAGLLVIVLAATFLILRRLRATERAVESRRGSSNGDRRTTKSKPGSTTAYSSGQYTKPSPSQIDVMSVDELQQLNTSSAPTPVAGLRGGQGTPDPSSSTFSPRQQTPYTSTTPDLRHPSVDSSGADYFTQGGRSHPGRQSVQSATGRTTRSSMDSQATTPNSAAVANNQQQGAAQQQQQQGAARTRHQSNASDVSELDTAVGLGSPRIPAELDVSGQVVPELYGSAGISPGEGSGWGGMGTGTWRRTSGSGSGPAGGGIISGGGRSRSGSYTSATHNRDRSGSSSVGGGGGAPALGVLSESAEIPMHGHYGPENRAAGQTHAGLTVDHDISSPLAVQFGQVNFPTVPQQGQQQQAGAPYPPQ